jgi:glycosyltransferase involved in cell wall biosynthesis
MLAKANIFISPRKKEGIGMSFLEALAMGMCIIANNEATMNEYLKNGENGYLFNLNNGQKINLSHWEEVRENSKKLATEGYGQWLKDKEKINNFISSTFTNKKTVGIIFQLNCLYLFSLENFKKIITKATRRK